MKLKKETVGFAAGEISPHFYGRTDLEKFSMGVAKAENFTIDFRGALKTRPGFEFMDFARGTTKLVPYFTDADSSDVLCVFSALKVSFIQDGSFLLESPKTVTSVAANVLTSAAHGFAVDDLVYLEGTTLPTYTYVVTAVTTNTFTVQLANGVIPPNSGSLSSATAKRVFTIATPYSVAALQKLRWHQRNNELLLFSTSFRTYKITPGSPFSLAQIDFTPELSPVTSITGTPSSAGSARMLFAVTTVDEDGAETTSPLPVLIDSSVNYTTTAGSMELSWPAVAGASLYRVYRSIITENASLALTQPLGFIGETRAPTFIDNNITPDFTHVPPVFYDPFENGTILQIDVTAGGSGYTSAPTVSISIGTGFSGYAIVSGGAVIAVIIRAGGAGYTASSVVSFSGGGGSGATASVVSVTPASGNYPACGAVFQQRQIYGGTINLPTTIFGSQVGFLDSFNYSDIVVDSDSYTFTLDTRKPVPIEHLVPQRNGLLAMHSGGIEKLSAAQGSAVTPTNYSVELEVAIGVGPTIPALINNDIIFCNTALSAVYALAYTFYSNSYSAQDLSVMASHLIGEGRKPERLEWVEEPEKLLWVKRSDGRLLSLTYVREQEVFAWAQHSTRGFFQDICALNENGRSVLYAVVTRRLNNVSCTTIERLSSREFELVEDYIGSDSALVNATPLLDSTTTLAYAASTDTLTAGSGIFSTAQVGDFVRAFGGKLEITAIASPTSATAVEVQPITDYIPGTTQVPVRSTWQIYRPFTVFSGLWHLEGQSLSVLADGSAYTLTVSSGSITLPVAATSVIAGLPYTCEAITLPLSIYERLTGGDYSRLVKAYVRMLETRGLSFGQYGKTLYEMKDRAGEDYFQPVGLRSEVRELKAAGGFVRDLQAQFKQTYPLPATIASLMLHLEVED